MLDNKRQKPKFECPNWLPSEVKQVFIDYIDEYSQDKYHYPKARPLSDKIAADQAVVQSKFVESDPELKFQRPYIPEAKTKPKDAKYDSKYKSMYKSELKDIDTWSSFVENIDFLARAFTWDITEQAWLSLYKESPDKAVVFAKALLRLNAEFETEVGNQGIFNQEKEDYIKILKKASQLLGKINQYDEAYDGYVEQGSYGDLTASLEGFISSAPDAVRNFDSYVEESSDIKTSYLAVGREHKSETGKARYFARRIAVFFIKEYGKPKSQYIADFIYALFDCHYEENTIIKITEDAKHILKCENSIT